MAVSHEFVRRLTLCSPNHLVYDKDVLAYSVGVVLRLNIVASPSQEFQDVIVASAAELGKLEKDIQLTQNEIQPFVPRKACHGSSTLWQGCSADTLPVWGFCVESLWRASMSLDNKVAAWDALTSRLLVWRAIAGDTTKVGEWARREVVRNIGS